MKIQIDNLFDKIDELEAENKSLVQKLVKNINFYIAWK